MNKEVQSKPVKATHFVRGVVREAVVLLVVFLLGFVPMWLKSRKSSNRLSEAERHINLASVQNTLASEAIDTR